MYANILIGLYTGGLVVAGKGHIFGVNVICFTGAEIKELKLE